MVNEEDGDVCTGRPECVQQVASELMDTIGEGSKDLVDDVFSKNDQFSSSTRPLITLPGHDRDNEMDPNLTFNIGAYKKVTKRKITFKRRIVEFLQGCCCLGRFLMVLIIMVSLII